MRAVEHLVQRGFETERDRHLDTSLVGSALSGGEPVALRRLQQQRPKARFVLVGDEILVIDPATPLVWIEHVLHLVDIVLVMTVNPGFGGQKFLPEMLPKIAALRALCDERGLSPHIEVDGGQDAATVASVAEAGADVVGWETHVSTICTDPWTFTVGARTVQGDPQ